MTQKDNEYNIALFAAYVRVSKYIGDLIYKQSQDKKRVRTEVMLKDLLQRLNYVDSVIKTKIKIIDNTELNDMLTDEFMFSFTSMMHIWAALPKDKRDIGEQLLEALQMGKLELENDSLTIKD